MVMCSVCFYRICTNFELLMLLDLLLDAVTNVDSFFLFVFFPFINVFSYTYICGRTFGVRDRERYGGGMDWCLCGTRSRVCNGWERA